MLFFVFECIKRMIIVNGDSKFTEEEKENLTVREYTNQETNQNKKAYIQKALKKMCAFNIYYNNMLSFVLYIARYVICN